MSLLSRVDIPGPLTRAGRLVRLMSANCPDDSVRGLGGRSGTRPPPALALRWRSDYVQPPSTFACSGPSAESCPQPCCASPRSPRPTLRSAPPPPPRWPSTPSSTAPASSPWDLRHPRAQPFRSRTTWSCWSNTSATETGQYRTQALEALKALLKNLGPQDRVQLMAVDVDAAPMTPRLVAVGSPELAAAVETLDRRAPLGTTNMEKALDAAAAGFAGGTAARSVVFIGSGTSKLNVLLPETYGRLVGALVDNRIAVSSLAVGPQVDKQLLGSLAANTGGVLLDAAKVAAADAGKKLAAAADGTVLWPKSAAWPAAMVDVLPKRVAPLRTDRESFVIGSMKGPVSPMDVKITVAGPVGDEVLSWKVAPGDQRRERLPGQAGGFGQAQRRTDAAVGRRGVPRRGQAGNHRRGGERDRARPPGAERGRQGRGGEAGPRGPRTEPEGRRGGGRAGGGDCKTAGEQARGGHEPGGRVPRPGAARGGEMLRRHAQRRLAAQALTAAGPPGD